MGLLKGHEWDYLQHTAVKKTEAVCWPDGYMIHPDREELFISEHFTEDSQFVVPPSDKEETPRTRKLIWKREDSVKKSFMEKLRSFARM